jgi:hypothetical protein
MQFPWVDSSNFLSVMFNVLNCTLRNVASLMYCLSYYPIYLCRWASSASKAAVDGYWKVKSSSSIVDSACWTSCSAVGWLVSGYSGSVGAGRAVTRGEASISVSLDVSAAGRLAICLVYTIV